ncbi:polyprenyl synthetase family protein [Desulfurispora thermophila]|uniref:polyprenyl synthetase family protein n=1 Tax=Desulfurispora thermophila TaxID=265470 RepID=UPI000360C8F8|nr:polyprenyl synthetase family protein [Desulfurispora thermophila]
MLDIFYEIRDDLGKVEEMLKEVVQAPEKTMTETALHLINAGGKRLRPAFCLLGAKFHNYHLPTVLPLAVALELIHMASLVHDDVVDAATTRRGVPTVKAMWGNRFSTHLGDFLFARSLVLISQYSNPLIPRVLARTSVQMTEGEIVQIATSFDPQQTVKDYFYRIKRKTALLIAASCQLGAVACGAPPSIYMALRRFGHYIGMAFQITDDILDMTADEARLGKPLGSDMRQGILTLPVIFALQGPHGAELKQMVTRRDKSQAEIERAIDLVVSCGAVEKANRVVGRYIDKARRQLLDLPDIPARRTMAIIAEFIIQRKF